jgi:aryl-alcohol dehydrogenase-like predicted oxidoreductase
MQKNSLGKTGLQVSALGFGCMELRRLTLSHAARLLNEALDRGISYIDTSPEYPCAEYFVGKAISHRRDEFVLATKCGDNMTGIGPLYQFDRKTITDNVEESLRLMKTDHIDVLQLHGVTPEDLPGGEDGEAMEAMRELKQAGKVLHLGLTACNKNDERYGYPAAYGYNSARLFAGWRDIGVMQLVYGGLTRLSENVIQKAYEDHGTGFVARGIVKYYHKRYGELLEVSKLSELFEAGESRHDFLIRYALSHPALGVSLCGTANIGHLTANAAAAEKGPLPPDTYAEAKRRLTFAGAVAGPADF